jgi:GMP synthase PP-ATPase subunit
MLHRRRLVTARDHPAAGWSGEQLAQLLDELDKRLRRELPQIGEIFIDITSHLRPTTMEAS